MARWRTLFSIIIFCSILACHSSKKQPNLSEKPKTQVVSLGAPIKNNGQTVKSQNRLAPLQTLAKGKPINTNLSTYEVSTDFSRTASTPSILTPIAPNRSTFLSQVSTQEEIKKVPAKQPIPFPATTTQRKDRAKTNLRYLDVYQGMNSPSVYSMLEDSKGNIWIGTVGGGISKYDGQTFHHFTTEHGLSANIVKCLLEDSEGNIWIGTQGGGLNKYDGETFSHFTTEQGLGSNRIFSLLEDREGNIWIGTDNGLFSYQKEEGILQEFSSGIETGYNNFLCLTEDQQGNIWMGTWEGALRYTPPQNKRAATLSYFRGTEGLNGKSVLSILEDQTGRIWFGSNEKGVTVYHPSNGELIYIDTQEGLSYPLVYNMLEDNLGNIWFATDGGGVSKLTLTKNTRTGIWNGKFSHFNTNNGLSHDNVLALLEDRAGNIWFGTWGGGINIYKPNGLIHFSENDGLPTNDIRAIVEDSNGDLWIGTWGKGILHYKYGQDISGKGEITQYTTSEGLSNDNILSMTVDHKGNLWIGTAGGGAIYFDRVRNTFTTYTGESGLSGYGVNTIMEDRKGNIWFGIDGGGVTRFRPDAKNENDQFAHFTLSEGLLNNNVSSILEDQQGNIWIGTQGGAVCLTRDGQGASATFKYLTTENGLRSNIVVSMLEDSKGNIWFGTWGGGLHKWNPENSQISYFSTDNGLNNNWVMGLVEDQEQNIWINTLKGFSVLIPNSKDAISSYDIMIMGEAEGLVRTGFWWNNVCIDQKGQIWWGVANGLATLDTRQLTLAQKPPEIYLNSIQINDQFIDFRRIHEEEYANELPLSFSNISIDRVLTFSNCPISLSLPHNLNHLTFHFSGIDWAAPQKIQYEFELKSADLTQLAHSQDHHAEYTNLPHGSYKLTAKAIGAAKTWSAPLSYSFNIRPPWWQTWWAKGLYLLMISGIVLSIYRFQLNRKLAAEETRRLAELDQFKTRFFTNITHEFRTPITVIMGMANQIKGHLRHKELIERNGHRLLQLVNQLLDLSKLEAGHLQIKWIQQDIIPYLNYLTQSFSSLAENKDIRIEFRKEVEQLMMDYDPEIIHQIMTNLMSNALKFTPEKGLISVELATVFIEEIQHLQIKVQDTGAGIPTEDLPFIFDRFYQSGKNLQTGGTGVGLAFVKELVEKMEGQIHAESQLEKGSTFSLTLPIHNRAEIKDMNQLPSITTEPLSKDQSLPKKAIEDQIQYEKLATVLIIEDNPDVSEYIEHCISSSYKVIKAFDGDAGVEKALQQVPDLIITDVMMPKKDGYEVCKILKTNRITSHIPIMMLTAKATDQEKLTGLKHGADAYLIKPFNEEELSIRLTNLLELQNKWQARFNQENSAPAEKAETLEDKFIAEAKAFIMARLDDSSYNVDAFSKDLGLSRSQLHRKLKAVTGLSATQFINDVRLNVADEMLRKENTNVSEVAYATGFEYPNYFAKLYKQKFGQAPSEVVS